MSEAWRVSTPEGVFETDLETLKQWISEGCVLPSDKVCKGNLSWIDAGRVPQLKAAFSGDTTPAQASTPRTVGCHNHPDAEPKYVCRMCDAVLCNDCTKFVRDRVPICSLCGDLCHEYRVVREKAERAEFQSSGFGIEDFVRAIAYPLQHKVALFAGALIYGFLLLLGIRGSALAWLIMFGCISHVITQVAWGRLNRSFMPDFTSSSFWEDRFVSASLGLGIMLVSWGPLIVLVFALVFGVLRSSGVVEASNPVSFLIDVLPYVGAGTVLGLLFLLFLGWGVFYYPMALTVAGYTQSFGSVINPLVGLDTIRRMGTTYFKAFAMVIVVQTIAFTLGLTISLLTSFLSLEFIGDLLGNFINATFTFYFNLVIACILGLSLFKCAHRLGISVD